MLDTDNAPKRQRATKPPHVRLADLVDDGPHGFMTVTWGEHVRAADEQRRTAGRFAAAPATALPSAGSIFSDWRPVFGDSGCRSLAPEHRERSRADYVTIEQVATRATRADLRAWLTARGRWIGGKESKRDLVCSVIVLQMSRWWPYRCEG